MALPPLYVEGLEQRALLGQDSLNAYKVGLIEAILKEALRSGGSQEPEAIQTGVRTALEVAQWKLPRRRTPDENE